MPPHYAVRTDRYKLIYFNQLNEWELFDLQTDPHELENLYANPKQQGTVTKLKKELARLKEQLNDKDQFADNLEALPK